MAESQAVYVHLLSPRALMPAQQGYSNVYVFYAPENFMISPRGINLLALQLSVQIPTGYLGRFFSLADMATRGVYVAAQELCPDSWWETSVVLFNHSDEFYFGARGQPVACLILERVFFPPLRQASQV
ncbi:E4 orf1 [Simian adenovirus 49]|uniref:E4 orf1 n=2 Tax=Simian mastadenovirus B TaxID=1962299 RepID=F2WTQ9_9ADEN|nr:E4 orf1 [Simian adenovirus 49]ADZ39862.1 E4 orf1 [Simian adenovirus 49]ADZ39893.1 E4 orf1 [Simian adenovirus 50]